MSYTFARALPKLVLSIFIVMVTGTASITAQALPVICNGTETASFTPALSHTNQSTTVSISQNIGPCGSSSLTATNNYQVTRDFSCSTFTGGPGINTFKWSNGEESTYSFNAVIAIINGSFLITQIGTINGGPYTNRPAIGIVELAPGDGGNVLDSCAANGVSNANGAYRLTIL
jgi:hypothetical protein